MSQKFLSGSEAAAYGAKLARVEVISAYPISPNTGVISTLSDMVSKKELDAEFVNVEGEHSAASVCAGAVSAGSRAFTATCGQGMAYMHEVLWMASGMALPFVIAVTNRGVGAPQTLAADYSDSLSERDSSIIQFYTEDAQEVVDSVLLAYRVCEHEDVLLPGFVSLEGYRLTHTYEDVEIPDQELVDRFLPKYNPKHAFFDPKYPILQGAGNLRYYSYMKYEQHKAMLRAKDILPSVYEEFYQTFGRRYASIETENLDDADLVVVGMGSMMSVARETIQEYKSKGIKVGLVKVRCFRPFPDEEIRAALSGAKKIMVVDRFNSPGAHGVTLMEIRSAIYPGRVAISGFIVGDADLSPRDFRNMIDVALDRADQFEEWYNFHMPAEYIQITGYDNYRQLRNGEIKTVEKKVKLPMAPGTSACQGCAPLLATRQVIEAMGDNAVAVFATGCMQAVASVFPFSGWNLPSAHFCFNNTAAAASGVESAFKHQKNNLDILVYGGDGGLADIGFQALSGAIERGHNLTYVCYDNEAYMNTGVQRSGTTPWMASTKTTPAGKLSKRKDFTRIMEAHGIYVATALPCFPADLFRKIRKARDIKGPAFVHILCPCPTGWEFDPSVAIELTKLAFETGLYVLYEYENGKRTISRMPKTKKPIEEYLSKQGRFSHLTPQHIMEIQRDVDKHFQELTAGMEPAPAK